MPNKRKLADALDERFFVPLRRTRTRRIGVELELPVWNLTPGKATDFDAVHAATEEFLARFDFPDTALDDTGALYRARDPKSGDELSFDCSFNTLELSFGPDEDLTAVHARFLAYYPTLQEAFNRHGHALTGMGINPRWRENRPEPIGNGRYRMLLHHLKSYSKYGGSPRFHDYPEFGLFSCASQVQIDADEENVIPVINMFNRLEPFKVVLFANSPFGKTGELLCGRDRLWSQSLHGLNPHNCGMYGVTLRSLADLAGYLESTSIYCAERGSRYLNFTPIPLSEYLDKGTIHAEYWDPDAGVHRNCLFSPEAGDVAWLRPFKFEDLTQRGTVEFRSVCEQPVREAFAPAAFHAGLAENVSALAELLAADTALYGHGYGAVELRGIMARRDWPSFIDRTALTVQLHRILDLAEDGLIKRGFKEEPFLAPLRRRADTLISPAREHMERLAKGESIESIATDYGALTREGRCHA
ncbi:MAG: glutamylcysteine synthetase [Kiritimatiellae bacterium]|nr:glutamylcysteine synthetase [Kiritimatiellia bacterium]MBP5227492.1 glutamylcysteine synthetase [Kiritimatiellia bacterium]